MTSAKALLLKCCIFTQGTVINIEKALINDGLRVSKGIRIIDPEENCPPVRVRVSFRVAGQTSSEQLSLKNIPYDQSNENLKHFMRQQKRRQHSRKHLIQRALQQQLTANTIIYCCKALHLRYLRGSCLCLWIRIRFVVSRKSRDRSSHLRCSAKKVFLKVSQNSQENFCARVSFLIKLQAEACNFVIKETLAQVFSVNFAKFLRTPLVTVLRKRLEYEQTAFCLTEFSQLVFFHPNQGSRFCGGWFKNLFCC